MNLKREVAVGKRRIRMLERQVVDLESDLRYIRSKSSKKEEKSQRRKENAMPYPGPKLAASESSGESDGSSTETDTEPFLLPTISPPTEKELEHIGELIPADKKGKPIIKSYNLRNSKK